MAYSAANKDNWPSSQRKRTGYQVLNVMQDVRQHRIAALVADARRYLQEQNLPKAEFVLCQLANLGLYVGR